MKLRRGQMPAALQEAELGLRQYPSKQTEWHWRFQFFEAEILDFQGKEREALALLDEEPPPAFAGADFAVRRKATQGSAHFSLRLFKEADQDLAEAEALAAKYHRELLGDVTLKKGTLQFVKGDAAAAEAAYKKARELAREQRDSFLEAAALGGLGVATTMEAHYDESIDWNRAAADLAQSVGATGSLARTLGNTGWSYIELGDYENALRFYNQAEDASVKTGLLADQAYWLTSIAYADQGLHDYAGAEKVLEKAVRLAGDQDSKETLVQCLSQLAWSALWVGKNDLAERYNQEAAGFEKQVSPRLAIDLHLLRGAIALKSRNYDEAQKSFLLVMGDPQASRFQQWRAQAEWAKVYADEGLDTKAEEGFLRSLKTSESVRESVEAEGSRLFFLSNTIVLYSNFVDFLMSKHRVEDALQVVELSRARTLGEGLGLESKALSFPLRDFHPRRIAQRRNAVLLDYWLGPEQSYLWVITPTKISSFTFAKQSEMEALVSDYRGAMQGGKDLLAGGGAAGKKLYSMLVEPAKKLIPPQARVIVLPDAGLYKLNFEALIAPEPAPHYWIEDVIVNTASSLTLLDSAAPAVPARQKRLLLIGNAEGNKDFSALPQADQEMKNIEKHFPESMVKVLEGKEATAAAYLKSHPEQFAYIHFVTHGTASVTRPLESAVVLSPDGDSYKLYARDIVLHHINASLVTISACNGEGSSYSGEGLVGLSWAFVRAGAHNVIGALWEVSDQSTPQLMDSLYGELWQGKDPATALRDAKLKMMRSNAQNVFRKPFYWAPFEIYTGP